MTVVIKQKSAIIPIIFTGDDGKTVHKFEYNATDEKLESFEKFAKKAQNDAKNIGQKLDNLTQKESYKVASEELRKYFDELCGFGAFDELYDESKNLIIVLGYLYPILDGVFEEIKQLGYEPEQNNISKKYLQDEKVVDFVSETK